jgi:hypothetical protein
MTSEDRNKWTGLAAGAMAIAFGFLAYMAVKQIIEFKEYSQAYAGLFGTEAPALSGYIKYVPLLSGALAGLLGVMGGLLSERHNVAAGIMMAVAAVLCLPCLFFILSLAPLILFVLGAVESLKGGVSSMETVPDREI